MAIFSMCWGHPNSRILLRANDGELVSSTVVLRVMAIPWDLAVIGLVWHYSRVVRFWLHRATCRWRLMVSALGGHPLCYHLSTSLWPNSAARARWRVGKQISTFSQRSVDRSQIRYCTTFKDLQLENVTDHFKFKVDIEGKSSEELVFPITIQWLKFTLLKNVALWISKTNRHILNSDHLQAWQRVEVAERELHFKLLSPLREELLLGTEVLQTNSVFNQQNITDGKISYEPQEAQETFTRYFQVLDGCKTHRIKRLYFQNQL